MAAQSITLAREIPWTEEPGGLQSKGSQESERSESTATTKSNTASTESSGRVFASKFYTLPD